ncbi:MAG: LuxR C-terminal-related transcriptional regulator [Solirubrobacteraceae bacterium]
MTRARSQLRSNVPADVTTFVGRERELRQIRDALGRTRLLSLIGAGGVGKTRLALAAARELGRAFAGGAWFVDLTAVRDGEFLEQTIRDAVPGVKRAGSLVDQIGDADLLLVLSDCEHIVTAMRELVGGLLPWCPGVRILTTTRIPLEVAGEHLLTVPPLPVAPQAGGAPSDAAALFANRALAATGAPPDGLDAADVDELCARLDGLPLAIELAAMKARTMAVRDIIDGLDDRFELLRGGQLDGPPRHRSLDAVLRWSWDLCDDAERELWTGFSTFVGSVTVDAIVDTCGYESALAAHEVVDRLVQRSLLLAEAAGGTVRFRMLDTIREFGRRALELRAGGADGSDPATSLRRRHLDHYRAAVAAAEPEWFGRRQLEITRRVTADMPNIRLAFDGALTDPGLCRHADALYADLWIHWIGSGHVNEGRVWAGRLFDRLDEINVAPSCRARWIRGWSGIIAGDIDDSVVQLERCLHEAPRRGTPQDAYMARGLLGACRAVRGEFDVARRDYGVAIEQARDNDDPVGTALLLQNLAELSGTYGDGDHALELCDASAAICRERGDRWCFSHVLWVRSLVGYRQRRLDLAWDEGIAALALKTEIQDQLGIALAGEVLAWIAAARDDHDTAAVMLGATDVYWRAAGVALYGLQPLLDARRACLDDLRGALGGERLGRALEEGARLGLSRLQGLATGEEVAGAERSARRSGRRAAEAPESAGRLAELTKRELEVAELVAQGMTNKEIAATLIVSRRTVDTHVAHILAKLGCGRRSEVARVVTVAARD